MVGERVEEKEEKRITCEVYSRIVGYLTPIQNWHEGKQQEWVDRVPFVLDESIVTEGE